MNLKSKKRKIITQIKHDSKKNSCLSQTKGRN